MLRFKIDENLPEEVAVLLRAAGHDVRVVLPFYARVAEGNFDIQRAFGSLEHRLGPHRLSFSTLESTIPGTDTTVAGSTDTTVAGGADPATQDPAEFITPAVDDLPENSVVLPLQSGLVLYQLGPALH